MKVDVLGTKYTVRRVDAGRDKHMDKNNLCGYCDGVKKEIVILNLSSTEEWKSEPERVRELSEKCTMRHELVHAFLNESGLQACSLALTGGWARNEEMVDWIALMSPKLYKAFRDLDAI